MKKLFTSVLAVLLTVLIAASFAACGGTEPAKDYDVIDIADKLAAEVPFEDEYLAPVMDVAFELNRIGVALDTVDEAADGSKLARIYVSGAYPEMIICLKAKDAAGANSAMASIQELISNYITNYSNYTPEQVAKLQSAVKVVKGQYVFVVVSNDNTAAGSALNKLLG